MIALSLLMGLVLYILLAWSSVRVVGWLADIAAFAASTKRILQVLSIAFFVLLPTWDIIPSRLYFQHLCKTEAGARATKTVMLEELYFLPDGRPDQKKLAGRYAQPDKRDHEFSRWAHIVKVESAIRDKQTGELLGTATDFVYYGGWLGARIAPMSPDTCPNYPNHSAHSIIWQEIFKLKQPSLPGGK
ncbi:MAG TPA: hypothetical protein VLA99_05035 [Nitrospiraceae bacterium]|nr:hypothetical protein [Nitrospiraceae bacterium]